MGHPFLWLGLVVCAGAAAVVWCPVPAPQLLAGILALAALALVGRAHRAGGLALLAAGFLLGALAVAAQGPAPVATQHTFVRGSVQARLGGRAVVRSPGEGWLLYLPPSLPVGTELALWLAPSHPAPALPGALPDDLVARIGHLGRARVRRLQVLGAPQDRPPQGGGVFAQATHGGLLRALATGRREGIDPGLRALLQRTGTAHLLAISGLHVGLVALVGGAAGWVLARPGLILGWRAFARVLPALTAVGAAAAYAQLAGWPISARRALCMVALAVVGRVFGRSSRPWNLWGAALMAVVLVDPAGLGSPGLWMSFGAVAGILSLPAPVQGRPSWLRGAMRASVGAALGVLPATALLGMGLSPVSPLANLVAVPLIGTVGVPAALLSLVLPGTAGLLALAVGDGAIDLAVWLLRLLDCAPLQPAVGPLGALVLGCVVVLPRWPGCAGALALLALGLRAVPADRLVITFLAVGQGDAALIEHPDGRRWLVDGGPSPTPVLQYLRRRGIGRLDAVFVSHPHPDHTAGLGAVLSQLSVDRLWISRPPEVGEHGFSGLIGLAAAQGTALAFPGEQGAAVLHPRGWQGKGHARVNDESLVLDVSLGRRRAVFLGDIEAKAEAHLAPMIGRADVVKVAHHGSKTSSSAALVQALDPQLAVISAGPGNRFGHPHARSLAGWSPATVLRTDVHGTIEVSTDGHGLSVRTWLPGRGWASGPDRTALPRAPGFSLMHM